jgi:hypothetical protein
MDLDDGGGPRARGDHGLLLVVRPLVPSARASRGGLRLCADAVLCTRAAAAELRLPAGHRARATGAAHLLTRLFHSLFAVMEIVPVVQLVHAGQPRLLANHQGEGPRQQRPR